jgi:hypothetical protein
MVDEEIGMPARRELSMRHLRHLTSAIAWLHSGEREERQPAQSTEDIGLGESNAGAAALAGFPAWLSL